MGCCCCADEATASAGCNGLLLPFAAASVASADVDGISVSTAFARRSGVVRRRVTGDFFLLLPEGAVADVVEPPSAPSPVGVGIADTIECC